MPRARSDDGLHSSRLGEVIVREGDDGGADLFEAIWLSGVAFEDDFGRDAFPNFDWFFDGDLLRAEDGGPRFRGICEVRIVENVGIEDEPAIFEAARFQSAIRSRIGGEKIRSLLFG
jgi:hypothetical protein